MKHLNKWLIAAAAALSLTACKEQVDLKNIDLTSELELGIAMPIGQASMTLGDAMGFAKGTNLYIDTLVHKGVITYKDTFNSVKPFHPVDLSQYISSTTLTMNVYEQLQAKGMIGANGKVIGTGQAVTLDFPIQIRLSGINSRDKQSSERIDSAYIETAAFTSMLSRYNNLPLAWDWIDQVTLDLGEKINRSAGNTMTVYSKGQNYGYDCEIPTDVDHFSINLMKDKHPASFDKYYNNVDSVVNFAVHFTFTIPQGQEVEVPENSGFHYRLGVRFMDYTAIWGMFEPSKDMHDEYQENISENWGDFQFLQDGRYPFAEPRIDLKLTTEVAGAIVVNGDYLYVTNAKGEKIYATFNGQRTFVENFKEGEYLGLDSKIGAVSDNMNILFDKDPARGHIDQLFGAIPTSIAYKFAITINQQKTPQMRITPNTGVNAQAIATLPLIFSQDVYISYSDTLKDINITQEQIDSLMHSVEMIDTIKTSDVKVVINFMNSIPLDIYAHMRCLDEQGKVIMDPTDNSKPLLLVEEDTIHISAPQFASQGGIWYMPEGGEGKSHVVVTLSQDKLKMLPKIRSIVYTATIDDKSLDTYYKKGMSQIRITEDNRLRVKIGLAAKVDAVINPNNKK